MHRSRLYAVIIDSHEAEAAVAFWSGALGASASTYTEEPQFTVLHGALPGIVTAVQSIGESASSSRMHIDIESDDPEAEIARLKALGATEVSHWLDCQVLRAPGGHFVCVLPVHSDPETFAAGATVWE